jgi:uncharacterized membrane protein
MGCCGGGMFHSHRKSVAVPPERKRAAAPSDPEAILKERLARGEITVEEYRQLREALRESVS